MIMIICFDDDGVVVLPDLSVCVVVFFSDEVREHRWLKPDDTILNR